MKRSIRLLTFGFVFSLTAMALVRCVEKTKKMDKPIAATPLKAEEGKRYPASLRDEDPSDAGVPFDRRDDELYAKYDGNYLYEPMTSAELEQAGKWRVRPMTASEKLGRDIWFKATAGNARFHMYSIPQRVGGMGMNWAQLLGAEKGNKQFDRYTRFTRWGLMNDPNCCQPGDDCDSKGAKYNGKSVTPADTFGLDYCPNDEVLLGDVRNKTGNWKDPACDIKNEENKDPALRKQYREDSCNLAYGNSAGAVGFRKFPNPRFDIGKWNAMGGSELSKWQKIMEDHSVEPPVLIGLSCASCHVSFDPTMPPADVNRPKWINLKGLTGNPFMYSAQIFASGFDHSSLEYQMLARSRPGIVDTSAVTNDQVPNASTINPIMNLAARPRFNEMVTRLRKWDDCSGQPEDKCWCEDRKNKPGKCWKLSQQNEKLMHVLKDGADSVGDELAVQRVYFNIGSCSEQCLLNNLMDFRALMPWDRGYGQNYFNMAQCRRDCGNFRAIEDRVGDVAAFLMTGRPYELADALGIDRVKQDVPGGKVVPAVDRGELTRYIEDNFGYGEGAVQKGSELFAQNCIQCHSSKPSSSDMMEQAFRTDKDGVRTNWFGSDERIKVSEPGLNTYNCRALHSNHNKGHIWEESGSDTFRLLPPVSGVAGNATAGRGYYRGFSLLSLWAFAPIMHNNGIGPELCASTGSNYFNTFKEGGVVDARGNAISCTPFPAGGQDSVKKRIEIVQTSLDMMLNPSKRYGKTSVTDSEIIVPILPKIHVGKADGSSALAHMLLSTKAKAMLKGAKVIIPKGLPITLVGAFRHKDFIQDFLTYFEMSNKNASPNDIALKIASARAIRLNADRNPAGLTDGSIPEITAQQEIATAARMVSLFAASAAEFIRADEIKTADRGRMEEYLMAYSNCTDLVEDKGHTFGEGLSPEEKKQLTAFLLTL